MTESLMPYKTSFLLGLPPVRGRRDSPKGCSSSSLSAWVLPESLLEKKVPSSLHASSLSASSSSDNTGSSRNLLRCAELLPANMSYNLPRKWVNDKIESAVLTDDAIAQVISVASDSALCYIAESLRRVSHVEKNTRKQLFQPWRQHRMYDLTRISPIAEVSLPEKSSNPSDTTGMKEPTKAQTMARCWEPMMEPKTASKKEQTKERCWEPMKAQTMEHC